MAAGEAAARFVAARTADAGSPASSSSTVRFHSTVTHFPGARFPATPGEDATPPAFAEDALETAAYLVATRLADGRSPVERHAFPGRVIGWHAANGFVRGRIGDTRTCRRRDGWPCNMSRGLCRSSLWIWLEHIMVAAPNAM